MVRIMSKPDYRQEDADRVWAWLGNRRGSALDIATALSISSTRVKLAVQHIRRDATYAEGIPITFGANGVYYRTAELDTAYLRGLVNQFGHIATRVATAIVEVDRAGNLKARNPEAISALFGAAKGHLKTTQVGVDSVDGVIKAIETLLG
jgi:hypothetical protein